MCSMYESRSRTTTDTRTQARRLSARVGAELMQMRAFYGRPEIEQIGKFMVEMEEYLSAGYLESVRYGFKRAGLVIFELIYSARNPSGLDDKPGRIPSGIDIAGASWFSYLKQNNAWWSLSPEDRERFRKRLPIERSSADEPRLAAGVRTASTKEFSEQTIGLRREVRST